ncbi:hypothetical protein J7E50_23490 [Pedobacter sp. ISL-68]|uniref:hypothetical protein n=1 Tax=unclassified Pedobacter TaxID=2628915 RepID=UPI001BE62D27|nr:MULTISPECIES: hypothetical protein [unclassified Pedobacter]MBT2564384.1 hypothetical protein [Pedobacter sp. ISL-64]MBT2593204.1 hypothetical protein [Pedobacter sp. ISL-68]
MQTLKHFEQQGNTYTLKVQKGLFYIIAFFSLAAIIAILIYSTSKANPLYIAFFVFVGAMAILRATAVLTFDNHNREIQRKVFFFSSPTSYSFDDFDHFLISKQKSYFITVAIQAILVMNKGNKTKHILLWQSYFTAKPLQRLNEEISEIMGLPS